MVNVEVDRVYWKIIAGFTYAGDYLHKAGYDGIELYGAYGYLLAQFLS